MIVQTKIMQELIVDNFAGGGGASTGMELATGRPVDIAVNHDRAAIILHKTNHPYTTKDREALTLAHLAEFKGQDIGQPPDVPLRTITASIGEFAAINTTVVKYDAGANMQRWPKVRELLNRYCNWSIGENEVLLLEIDKTRYLIADIGLRMLTPRELYNAQGFPPDYIIDRDYTGAEYGKTQQVARCGNAVCPPLAEATTRANYESAATVYTTMA